MNSIMFNQILFSINHHFSLLITKLNNSPTVMFSIHQHFSQPSLQNPHHLSNMNLERKSQKHEWTESKNHDRPYLCNSFGASVPHHARPSSHQCDAKHHPHENPRKQTHFPRCQTPPFPFQHKNTNQKSNQRHPHEKKAQTQPLNPQNKIQVKSKTKLSVKFE